MSSLTFSEKTVFLKAIELSVADRSDYLDRACGSNGQQRRQIERLLAAHVRTDLAVDQPVVTSAPGIAEGAPAAGPDSQIGPYKLLEQIGEGGMGVVYMAEQTHPVLRRVALKIIKPGMDTRQVIARFEAERQALAMMDHANICKVFDGGSTESGHPYFAMELVRGLPITEFCDQQKLTTRDRLRLFICVCRAVQHAHQKGIIHRDLKPTNVLVSMHDDMPIPKVIDFGIAKAIHQPLTDKTLHTSFAQLIGSPLYMSPEQVEPSGLDVDTRSDVYSLGVMLYELLTGNMPFDRDTIRQSDYEEVLRLIREQEPAQPSVRVTTLQAGQLSTASMQRGCDPRTLGHLLRGELDWIVMKALEKNRTRRYESASAFAADVERYLADEPVHASPPSSGYRLRKFARRNRVAMISATVVSLALVLGTVVSTWQAIRATRAEYHAIGERQKAQEERQKAVTAVAAEQQARQAESLQRQRAEASEQQANDRLEEIERQRSAVSQNLYFSDMRLGMMDWNVGNVARLSGKLLSHVPQTSEDDLRGWEWYYLLGLCHQEERTLMEHTMQVKSVAWSPDGRYVGSTGHEGKVCVYANRSWRLLRTWSGENGLGARWSPDSRQLAWGTTADDSGVFVGQVETGELKRLGGHTSSVWTTAWSPDGRYLASGGMDHTIRIWEPETGLCIRVVERVSGYVHSLAWHPTEPILASLTGDSLAIWDAESWEMLHTNELAGEVVARSSVAWSPDGTQLALGTRSGKCRLYETADWSIGSEWRAHRAAVNSVAWNADGNRLVSVGADHLIQLWDPSNGSCVQTLRGHLNQVRSVAWEPGGSRLVSGGMDGLVKVWPIPPASNFRRLEGHPDGTQDIAWCEEENTLRSLGVADGTIAHWNVVSGQRLADVPVPHGSAAAFSSGGKLLAITTAVENESEILIHDARSGEQIQNVTKASAASTRCALSADGSWLALSLPGLVASKRGGLSLPKQGAMEVLDVRHNEVCLRGQITGIRQLSWSPDGRLLALAGNGQDSDGGDLQYAAWVHVFDIDKQQRVMKVQHGNSRVSATAVAWSPDGQRLVSGDENGLVEIREVPSGYMVASERMHSARINSLAWSPDGRRISSVSLDGTVRISAASSGEELLQLDIPEARLSQLEWSPDGRRLAAVAADGAIYVWDATAGYEHAESAEYQAERVHDQLRQVTQRWEAGLREEALAFFEQTVEQARPDSLAPWVVQRLGSQAKSAERAGRYPDALTFFRLCLRLNKDDAWALKNLAWLRATCPDLTYRDPDQAVQLAQQAFTLAPLWPDVSRTLGVAQYRAGDWTAAVTALENSIELDHGGNSFEWFFLAMAHWQLGNEEEARKWHDQAVQWMEQNLPQNEQLRRFRLEAEEVLKHKSGDTDEK